MLKAGRRQAVCETTGSLVIMFIPSSLDPLQAVITQRRGRNRDASAYHHTALVDTGGEIFAAKAATLLKIKAPRDVDRDVSAD